MRIKSKQKFLEKASELGKEFMYSPTLVANHLGIRIEDERLIPMYGYYSHERKAIIIHEFLSGMQRELTLAHEIGEHIFFEYEGKPMYHKTIQSWCDEFARALLGISHN